MRLTERLMRGLGRILMKCFFRRIEVEGVANLPEDAAARGKLFEAMVEVVAADGTIDPRELALFERLAPRFGLSPEQATQTLEVVRALLDARARRCSAIARSNWSKKR